MPKKAGKPKLNRMPSAPVHTGQLAQVQGWSVHCPDEGRLGPLFCSASGKLFYLDTRAHSGFLPVSPHFMVYID